MKNLNFFKNLSSGLKVTRHLFVKVDRNLYKTPNK